jgi:mRNA interferase MazF
MKEGDVILTPVPQADGELKERPAIFLREMPLYRDLLVCGVSTQLHQYVKDFDEIISPANADFKSSGLRSKSLIRLSFLVVLPRHRVLGSIGSISAERHKRLLRKLSDYLTN